MIEYLKKAGLTVALITLVAVVISFCFKPFSLLNYVGPMAGVVTALVLLWGARSSGIILIVLCICTFISSKVFAFDIDASFALISILAISLQAFWCFQITSDELSDDRWLSRRSDLMSFLLKVGPLGSLVSTAAVIIIAILQNDTLNSGLIFTFFSYWSLALIISVFTVSLVLFSQSKSDISIAKKVQVVLASVLGVVALCLLFKVTQKDFQYQRVDEFDSAEQVLITNIKDRIETISEQLQSLAAFFSASNQIDSQEFDTFSEHIFSESSGVKLLAWAPTVETSKVDAFNASVQRVEGQDDFQIRAMDPKHLTGQKTQFHVPMRFIFPKVIEERYVAIDLYAHAENKVAMEESAQSGNANATAPLRSDLPGLENANIYVFYPLYKNYRHNPYLTADVNTSIPTGYLITVVDVFEMFNPTDLGVAVNDRVSLHIEDVTAASSQLLYGNELVTKNRLSRVNDINAFSRQWRVSITEKQPWLIQQRGWLSWAILLGSTLGGILYQFLILLMTAYSTELKQKITYKTRELILAKENSENASQAKSQFLQMLSNELKVPIKAIAGYIEQLKKQSPNNEQKHTLDDIRRASEHLGQFVQTIKDMSEIETGQLSLQRKTFNFHEFIKRMESMSNVTNSKSLKKLSFVIHKDVPVHLDGDELRLQQVFSAIIINGALIFNKDALRVSVNAHMHKHSSATIFLVVTPSDALQRNDSIEPADEEEFSQLNTTMTLAQEICHQLGGDIRLLPTSDNYMISASFQLDISEKDAFHFDSQMLDKYQQV